MPKASGKDVEAALGELDENPGPANPQALRPTPKQTPKPRSSHERKFQAGRSAFEDPRVTPALHEAGGERGKTRGQPVVVGQIGAESPNLVVDALVHQHLELEAEAGEWEGQRTTSTASKFGVPKTVGGSRNQCPSWKGFFLAQGVVNLSTPLPSHRDPDALYA